MCRRAGPVGDQMGNVMIRAGRSTNAHRPGRIATASFSAVVIGFAAALTMLYYGGTAHGADDAGAGAGDPVNGFSDIRGDDVAPALVLDPNPGGGGDEDPCYYGDYVREHLEECKVELPDPETFGSE